MQDRGIRPRRSALYMPGSNRRALEKARTLPADVLILDLEDAVAPTSKDEARRQVCEFVAARAFGYREVTIRVNALDTPWGQGDVEAAVRAQPDAIILPKVGGATEALEALRLVRHIEKAVGLPPGTTRLWAMIETPAGVTHVADIAAVEGVDVLVMGTSDLVKELRCQAGPDRTPLLYALSRVVLAARLHGKDALDGVFLDLQDPDGFEASCIQGRALGFDGKTLIHPSQIEVANMVFGPAAEEVEQARRVISAWEEAVAAGQGVVVVDGRLVENLHVDEARRTLAFADALAARAQRE